MKLTFKSRATIKTQSLHPLLRPENEQTFLHPTSRICKRHSSTIKNYNQSSATEHTYTWSNVSIPASWREKKRKKPVLTALKNFSDSWHLDPKLLGCNVMFSFVWESNDGFSIKQLTKTHIWFFTC